MPTLEAEKPTMTQLPRDQRLTHITRRSRRVVRNNIATQKMFVLDALANKYLGLSISPDLSKKLHAQ
jgi:hypothetical protein